VGCLTVTAVKNCHYTDKCQNPAGNTMKLLKTTWKPENLIKSTLKAFLQDFDSFYE